MSIDPSWRVCPDESTPSHACRTETAVHHAARLLAQDPDGIGDFVTLPTSCTCLRHNWVGPSANVSGCLPSSTWLTFAPTDWPSS